MIRKLLLLFPLLVACSRYQSFQAGSSIDPMFLSASEPELVPSTDRQSGDCRTNTQFDACIFNKNPVAQQGASVTNPDSLLLYGVKIRDVAPTGNLENAYFEILTLRTPRLSLSQPGGLKSHLSDAQSYVEQTMAYYWADRAFAYLAARVGPPRLQVKGLKIYVDDGFTGFSAAHNSISLSKKSGEVAKALSGEVVVQLVGQALAYQLSGGKSFDLHSTAQHNFCSLNPKGCCASEMGCANALNSAFGDYVAAMIFPQSPRLGETVAANAGGQTLCGLKRDLVTLSAQTRTAVFNACSSKGSVTAEGAWYASLWWKMRLLAEAGEKGAGQDIDILFFEHARQWAANATFAEAKQAALDASASYKSGKFTSLLQTVLAAAL